MVFFIKSRKIFTFICKNGKMKVSSIILAAFTFLFAACNNNSSEIDKSDPLESGRGFIEASLKGDYINAKKYLLEDTVNLEFFDRLKDFTSRMSREDRYGYSAANIIIDSSISKSDSVDIIYYSNSYKRIPSKIKMVKKNNEWLVDFKYTFTQN